MIVLGDSICHVEAGDPMPNDKYHEMRRVYPNAYMPWTDEEELRLAALHEQGFSVNAMADQLGRQPGWIQSRLRRLSGGGAVRAERIGNSQQPTIECVAPPAGLRAGEIAFLPLALSRMDDSSTCVAGIDLKTQQWVRLVRSRGWHSISASNAKTYDYASIFGVVLGGHEARNPADDPRNLGLHVEDRLLLGKPRRISPIKPSQRLSVLTSKLDARLLPALLEKRSLFLVEPRRFEFVSCDEGKLRVAFDVDGLDTRAIHSSSELRARYVRISRHGCSCNCLARLGTGTVAGHEINTDRDVSEATGGARVFFALSLGAWARTLEEPWQGHYLILAGMHVIDKERSWL